MNGGFLWRALCVYSACFAASGDFLTLQPGFPPRAVTVPPAAESPVEKAIHQAEIGFPSPPPPAAQGGYMLHDPGTQCPRVEFGGNGTTVTRSRRALSSSRVSEEPEEPEEPELQTPLLGARRMTLPIAPIDRLSSQTASLRRGSAGLRRWIADSGRGPYQHFRAGAVVGIETGDARGGSGDGTAEGVQGCSRRCASAR